MYKVNINATYFENNLKINQQVKEGSTKCKAKFLLTELQKQFIQIHLPKGYRLNMSTQIDQKRNRTPKKADAQFDTQFFKKDEKVMVMAYQRKRQQRKAKQKQQLIHNLQQLHKINKIEQQQEKPAPSKETHCQKKNNKNPNTEQERKKIQEGKPQQVKNQAQKIDENSNFATNKKQNPPPTLIIKKNSKSITQQIKKQVIKQLQKTPSMKQENNKQKTQQFPIQPITNIDIPVTVTPSQNIQQKPNQQYLSNDQKQFCLRFINKLRAHKSSWPFRLPVDPINQGVPNYLEIIHEPMDLKSIQKKININKYEHIAQFHADINKIFLNSYKFNPKETNYYSLTIQLENYYHQILKQLEANPNVLESDKSNRSRAKLANKIQQDFVQEQSVKKSKALIGSSKSIAQVSNQVKDQIKQKQPQNNAKISKSQSIKMKKKLSENDKKELVKKISKLPSKSLQSIINIVFGEVDDDKMTFQLDFEKLSDQLVIKIENFLRFDLMKFEDSKSSYVNQTRMVLF